MNVKVLKKFRDKHTKKVYHPGEVIKVAKKRFAEIVENLGEGYVAEVVEGPPESDAVDGDEANGHF